MLVLTRRVGEEIVLKVKDYHVATIRVQQVDGNKVRLGFTARPIVTIFRRELLDGDD